MHQTVDPHPDHDSHGNALEANRAAHSCRWSEPTLFRPFPQWLEADDRPWSCLNPRNPHPFESTEACRTCAEWEPEPVKRR